MKHSHSTNLKSAFTLVEILVVTSIISLLSSITITSVSAARIKAEDTNRIQSVREINTAINLYLTDKGYVPPIQECGSDKFTENEASLNPRCVAVQTADNGSKKVGWDSLQADLEPYMKNLPKDPCGTTCDGLGYTYISPAAIYNFCSANESICDPKEVNNSSYQIFAPLKGTDKPFGYSTNGPLFGDAAVSNY